MRGWRALILLVAGGAACATAPPEQGLAAPEARHSLPGPVHAPPPVDDEEAAQEGPRRSGSLRASAYVLRPVRGFDVRMAPDLIDGDQAEVGARALDALDRDLGDVLDQTPAIRHDFLRSVPIYLGVADPVAPCACYHPSARWLERNGFDPAKARSVEISSARTFVDWRRHQPSMVLHELAHALHDQVLRPEQPRLEAALEAVRSRGSYDQTLRWSGAIASHYALTTVDEYFAETTESLLGVNDFYPFVRAELLGVDPEGAALVAALWKDETQGAGDGPARGGVIEALEHLAEALEPGEGRPGTPPAAALAPLLARGFELVERDGRVRLQRDLLESSAPFPARPALPVDLLSSQPIGPLHTVVTFRAAEDGATCSAVLERSAEAPGGLRWLRLQVSGPGGR